MALGGWAATNCLKMGDYRITCRARVVMAHAALRMTLVAPTDDFNDRRAALQNGGDWWRSTPFFVYSGVGPRCMQTVLDCCSRHAWDGSTPNKLR